LIAQSKLDRLYQSRKHILPRRSVDYAISIREKLVDNFWNNYQNRVLGVFAVTCLLVGGLIPTFAEDVAKLTAGKWRPKEGVYAVPGPDHVDRCMERDEAFVELSDNSLGGDEYGCTVNKLADTAPGAIKLDVTCDDSQAGRSFKEVILLNKVDDNTIFWRGTSRGKLKQPGARFLYCPEEVQRLRREANARDKAEAERRAAEERAKSAKK
jgi:hypothetical protein